MKVLIALTVVALIGGIVGIALALAPSRPAGAADHPKPAIEIGLEDLRFEPNRVTAQVGRPVRLVLVNRGSERHDLNFPSLHMPGLRGEEAILDPGERRTVTLTFDEPGTHTFICTRPGHAVLGMSGAVFVRP